LLKSAGRLPQLLIFAMLMLNAMKKLILPFLLFIILANTLVAQDVILKKGQYVLRESGKLYTGIFKEYDSEKRLISATCIKDGLLNDSTTIYYPSGVIKEVRAYKAAQKHGTWKTWNEEGKLTAEASFKNGKKDGFWYVWDDQGIKRYEMFYENGEKKGVWIIRDENGNETSHEEFK
jgi:antitoxin component YwqK of YwqJK toxin-antitoxin module